MFCRIVSAARVAQLLYRIAPSRQIHVRTYSSGCLLKLFVRQKLRPMKPIRGDEDIAKGGGEKPRHKDNIICTPHHVRYKTYKSRQIEGINVWFSQNISA